MAEIEKDLNDRIDKLAEAVLRLENSVKKEV
jgi:hypothetical protein